MVRVKFSASINDKCLIILRVNGFRLILFAFSYFNFSNTMPKVRNEPQRLLLTFFYHFYMNIRICDNVIFFLGR